MFERNQGSGPGRLTAEKLKVIKEEKDEVSRTRPTKWPMDILRNFIRVYSIIYYFVVDLFIFYFLVSTVLLFIDKSF